MEKRYRDYQEDLIEDLKNRKEAAAYLQVTLEEGNPEEILLVLRNIIKARSQMQGSGEIGQN